MEKYLSLPVEKQSVIRNAALAAFGSMGYKKASMNDIAVEAGISKSMMFHYFGSKKALYLYLIEYSGDLIVGEIHPRIEGGSTDFFERLRLTTDTKIAVLKNSPYLLRFLSSMHKETDPEVAGEIKRFASRESSFPVILDDADADRFRQGVDMALVLKMLRWMAEGYISEIPGHAEADIDRANADFYRILELLKTNLYREEWL